MRDDEAGRKDERNRFRFSRYRPLVLVLARRALALLVRRFALYAAAMLVAIVAQGAVALLWPGALGLAVAAAVIEPLLTTLVYAFVAADLHDPPPSAAAIWERILERAWAVIIIDFAITMLEGAGFGQAGQGGVLGAVTGWLISLFAAMLVFADASATLDDDRSLWALIPTAFSRSVILSTNPRTFWRVIVLFALNVTVFAATLALQEALTRAHVWNAPLWANIPLGTLAILPIAALTVLVYVDACGVETGSGQDAS